MVKVTVDSIVKEYLGQIGDQALSRYLRFYGIAVSGIREWNMDVTGLPQIALIDVDSADRGDLPPGYINYVKIGICGADGQVYPLAVNNNICLDRHYDACGNVEAHTSDYALSDGVAFTSPGFINDHFRNGQVIGRFFGIGGGQNANGYFRIDQKLGQIIFQNLRCSVTQVYMEYIQDITVGISGDYEVHPFMIQTLKYWIRFQALVFDTNASQSSIAAAEDRYMREYRKSKRRFKSSPLSEWYKAIRSGNNAAVKF